MINFYDFIANSDYFKKFAVNETLFTEYNCPIKEEKLSLWSHANAFVYVLGGRKKWITQKNEYLIKAGDSIFLKKGANHIRQYFDTPFCVLVILISDNFIKQVIDKSHPAILSKTNLNIETDNVIRLNIDEVLIEYFHSVLSYFTKKEPPPKELLTIKFEELILNFLSNPNNLPLVSYFKNIYFSSKISIKEIMEANFTHDLNLEEFARLCCRSVSTFKRDFINVYGTTPGKWLTERRLEHSKYLIQTTRKTIDEIILDSGFKNKSHFSRIFKEKFGVTPLKIRNN